MSSLRSRSGGTMIGEDVQPVIEILAELAGLHHLDHVAVGGRNQPDVDLDRAACEPTGSISPSWMARSSFTCMSSGSSATSSRNSVPPSASWNLPMCLTVAPVKAPFSWPNRIDSTRFSGMAPQLTATKGRPRALALALDGAGDHFLADARFAFDQDRDVGLRAALAEPQHIGHGGRGGDEVAEGQGAADLLVEALHLFGERIDLQQVLDRDLEALRADRLHHEIIGAGAHRLDDGFDRALRGLHDDRQVAAHRLQAFEEFEPVHARHVEVEDDEFDGAAGLASAAHRAPSWPPSTGMGSQPKRLTISSRILRWAGSSSTMRTRTAMRCELLSKTVNVPGASPPPSRPAGATRLGVRGSP